MSNLDNTRGLQRKEDGPEEVGRVVRQRDPRDGQQPVAHQVDKRPEAELGGPRDEQVLPHLARPLAQPGRHAVVRHEEGAEEDARDGRAEAELAERRLEQRVAQRGARHEPRDELEVEVERRAKVEQPDQRGHGGAFAVAPARWRRDALRRGVGERKGRGRGERLGHDRRRSERAGIGGAECREAAHLRGAAAECHRAGRSAQRLRGREQQRRRRHE